MNKYHKKNMLIAESIAIIVSLSIIIITMGNIGKPETNRESQDKLEYYYKRNDSAHPTLVIDRGGHNNIHCLDYVFIPK